MKKLTTIILLLTGCSCLAQVSSEVISKKNIKAAYPNKSKVECENSKFTDKNGKIDYYIVISYQNESYNHITDTKSIFLFNGKDVEEFIKAANDAILAIKEQRHKTIAWEKKNYKIIKFDNQVPLTFYDVSATPGSITISPKEVKKLLTWIQTCKVDE